jgi:hypothetical protein
MKDASRAIETRRALLLSANQAVVFEVYDQERNGPWWNVSWMKSETKLSILATLRVEELVRSHPDRLL